MKRLLSRLAVLGLGLFVVACGGGSNGSGKPPASISVTPGQVFFSATRYDEQLPGQKIHVSYTGFDWGAGFPVGEPDCPWIQLYYPADAGTSFDAELRASDTSLAPGTYHTTVRFVTAWRDDSDVTYLDVPVTYEVKPCLSADKDKLVFDGVEGIVTPSQTLTIKSPNLPYDWSATIQYITGYTTDWLHLSTESGRATLADQPIQVSVDVMPVNCGGTANILLKNNLGITVAVIPVEYSVRAKGVLPSWLYFRTIEGGEVPVNKILEMNSNFAPWDWTLEVRYIRGESDWLHLSKTSDHSERENESVEVSVSRLPYSSSEACIYILDLKGNELGTSNVIYNVESNLGFVDSQPKNILCHVGDPQQLVDVAIHATFVPSDWSIDVEYSGENTNWLHPSISSGSNTGVDQVATLTFDSLPSGYYNASLILRNANGEERGRIIFWYSVLPRQELNTMLGGAGLFGRKLVSN